MPRETNEGVMMSCKIITANFLTKVRLLVGPITPLAKQKDSIQAYLSIRQPLYTVTFSNLVISPFLSSFFSFGIMLRSHIY